MFKQIAFLVFALAALYPITESHSLGYFSPYLLRRYISLAQALSHGDECTWEAEEARQNYTRRMMSSTGNSRLVFQMAGEFVRKDYKLCSALELFVCDRESQKCVCGDAGYETLYGVNRSLYTLEENGKCRWGADTYCASDSFLRNSGLMGLRVDSQCQSGTTCKTRDNQVCSYDTMLRYIFAKYDLSLLMNKRFVMDELSSGRVCTCKVDEQTTAANAYDWDDEEPENDIGSPAVTTTSTSTTTSSPEISDEVDPFVDAPAADVRGQASVTMTPTSGLNSEDEFDNEISRRRKRSLYGDDEFDYKMIAKYAAGCDCGCCGCCLDEMSSQKS